MGWECWSLGGPVLTHGPLMGHPWVKSSGPRVTRGSAVALQGVYMGLERLITGHMKVTHWLTISLYC